MHHLLFLFCLDKTLIFALTVFNQISPIHVWLYAAPCW